MAHKVIFLNGPPGCGKDTLADYMCKHNAGLMHCKFAWPLKRAVPAFFGLTESEWRMLETHHKDENMPELLGYSPRHLQISMSEDWMKPFIAKDGFGCILAEWMGRMIEQKAGNLWHEGSSGFVISDSGFVQEAYPVVAKFGHKNCLLIQIRRKGCSYKNDSRSFIDLSSVYVEDMRYDNNGTMAELSRFAKRVACNWVPERSVDPSISGRPKVPGK